MDVLILSTQSGDWEGMYIDGTLIEEAHTLGEGNNFFFLLEMSEKYGFKRADVRTGELNDEDDEEIMDSGSLPDNLTDLKGKY